MTPDRTLDVREIDGPPFEPIVSELAELDDGETLLLIAPFEPVPLYGVLDARGLTHETANPDADRWEVQITRA